MVPEPLTAKVRAAALSIQRKSWEQGVLATAFLEEGNDELVIQMCRASMLAPSRDGKLIGAIGGAPVDPVMLGEGLWHAAKLDPRFRAPADSMLQWVLHDAPRAPDGTIYHLRNQVWSDSFHTTPPFLAMAGEYDEAIRQIELHRNLLWDADKRLLSHKWDVARGKFARKAFWGGGNGWAAAAVARVIRHLPAKRQAERDRLAAFLKDLIDGCCAHQRADGLFHDIVDRPTSFIETNLAQMLAYAIYESIRGGWLGRAYLDQANRMRAAARAKVDEHGFVQGVCGAPKFDRAGISAEGQAFFLMMEAARGRLK